MRPILNILIHVIPYTTSTLLCIVGVMVALDGDHGHAAGTAYFIAAGVWYLCGLTQERISKLGGQGR